MLGAITRRAFLQKTAVVPLAGPIATGCGSEAERLSSELEGVVNALATEVIERGRFSDSPGAYERYILNKDWRRQYFEDVVETMFRKEAEAHGRQYGNLAGQIHYNKLQIELQKAFDEKTAIVDAMEQRSQLKIVYMEVSDSERGGNTLGRWGARGFFHDMLKIAIFTKDGYEDTLRFAGVTTVDGVRVFYTSKEENIKNIQKFYQIPEDEARKRLDDWLPAMLRVAEELYVAPSVLPQEKWLPKNLWGQETYVRRKSMY